jgi:uncharacterized protein YuzE
MRIRYFTDTDTLYLELNDHLVTETREINENTLIDLDANGDLVALTLEHARGITDLSEFLLQQVVNHPA